MIIAVDFDGVLCRNKFPDIGEPNYSMISTIRELIDNGHEVILWTSRVDKELESAVKWCEDRGLHFCAINDNAPSNIEQYIEKYPNGTRKVYADVYVDDHNLEFVLCRMNNDYNWAIGLTERYLRKVVGRWKEGN